jgi:uncharacterized protein YcbX
MSDSTMPLTLSALHVYPVKGLKGIELSEGLCTGRGLQHDRRWMVVDPQGRFLTQREHPRMATVWTELGDGVLCLSAADVAPVEVPLHPEPSATMPVRVWDTVCEAVPVSHYADAWLGDYLGMPCRLVYMPEGTRRESDPRHGGSGRLVGFADGYAYLLATEASLEELNGRLARKKHGPLPMNRFRPNLVVRGASPFAEDGWTEIRVGGAVLRAVKPCGRCEVTTTDQATGEVAGPEPLATLAAYRGSREYGVRFGMNLVTVQPGKVAVGDTVTVA